MTDYNEKNDYSGRTDYTAITDYNNTTNCSDSTDYKAIQLITTIQRATTLQLTSQPTNKLTNVTHLEKQNENEDEHFRNIISFNQIHPLTVNSCELTVKSLLQNSKLISGTNHSSKTKIYSTFTVKHIHRQKQDFYLLILYYYSLYILQILLP